jgi:phage terminase Nu1 subunit (DNA packaging protein)
MAEGEIVSRRRLARIMGVTPPTVDGWVRRGCPVVARPSRETGYAYRFDTAAVVRWRMVEARCAAIAGGSKEDT